MPIRTRTVSTTVSTWLHGLDRRLHIDDSSRTAWAWALPAIGFVVPLTILVVAGVMSGVWAAEYVPTAIVVGLVIAGLFVACTLPEPAPPWDEGDDHGHDHKPSSPPSFDPTAWMPAVRDLDADPETLREPVGASR
ncbi:MAG: tripartite tricarboxylate transporter TctB family protein [Candidatus Dormibacteraeota bacterium]|nr:tripartite tricarboxylate transporter TctB family protein [Candidatus Dormibacteraeota bacterium]